MEAFTIKSKNGILRVLSTPISVLVPNTKELIVSNAIWDTGATASVITQDIVDKLNLKPTGMSRVSTANGVAEQNTYIVDIQLPNDVTIKDVTVTGISSLPSNCDVLVGMDIISLGDFSVTNYNGITCMSFRTPSSHEIDYVISPSWRIDSYSNNSLKSKNSGVLSRNTMCPCRSGKKYKNCCGK